MRINEGQGMKVEAEDCQWGVGNVIGGQGMSVGAGECQWGWWGLGPVWR